MAEGYMGPLKQEIDAVVTFLCERDPLTFKLWPGRWDTFVVEDPLECILLASQVPHSFFLKGDEGQNDPEIFNVPLPYSFAGLWARDLQLLYPQVFERRRKVVRFVRYWTPHYELGGAAKEKRKQRVLEETLAFLRESEVKMGDCLLVPYYEYRSGYQLGEEIYHYLTGLIFKEMGYLVCNEWVVVRTEIRPHAPTSAPSRRMRLANCSPN